MHASRRSKLSTTLFAAIWLVGACGSDTTTDTGAAADIGTDRQSSTTTSLPDEPAAPGTVDPIAGDDASGGDDDDDDDDDDATAADADENSDNGRDDNDPEPVEDDPGVTEDEPSADNEPVVDEVFDSHDAFENDQMALLVPSPQDLGDGWDDYSLHRTPEDVLFDPAEATGTSCGLTQPVVVRDGLIGEIGHENGNDTAKVVLSRGNPNELAATFVEMRTLVDCPSQLSQGAKVETKSSPELPGALLTFRFAAEDDTGRHQESLLVLRSDLVYYLDTHTVDGSEPVDLDDLALDLLSAYDR